jgi:outer membrane autotransporter protein
VTGSITNSGTITGTAYTGIYFQGSAITAGISNSGTISGGIAGIKLRDDSLTHVQSIVTGGINNSGLISATAASSPYYVRAIFLHNSTVNGGINNTGGTISATGTGGNSIHLQNGSTVNGGINNSGMIAGNVYGIGLYGINLNPSPSWDYSAAGSTVDEVNNSGTISGGTKAIFVDTVSSLNRIIISGNNTAKFIGEVDAINTPVTVASGATYTMDNGQLFTLNGTSSGFNVAGTLGVVAGGTGTVTGNYTQDSTGVFRTNVIDATTYGKLVVSGSATLASSARIQVGLDSGTTLANGDSLQDVISAGTLTQSAFSVGDNSMAINFNAVNDGANHIDLTAVATGMTTVTAAVQSAGMSSQIGAAGVLDSLMANPAGQSKEITDFLYSVTSSGTPQDVANVVGQVMPLLNGGVTQSTFAAMHAVNDAIQARHESGSGVSSGDAVAGGDRYFWAKPFGSLAGQDNRSGAAGYDASTYGLVIGADTVVSNTDRVGSAFAYSSTNVDGNTTAAMHNAEIDSYQITLYGSHDLSVDTNINYQVDIGQHSNRSSRNMENLGLVATADFKSTSAHVGIDVAKTMALGTQTTFTPSVSADYSGINVHGYTETGALGWNQTVDKVTADELVIGVDGKLTRDLSDTSSLSGNLGFGYDLLGEQNSITASFAGEPGAIFTTLGIDPSPWLTRGGMGFVTKMTSGMEVSARYDVEYREDFLNQSASVKLRWAF